MKQLLPVLLAVVMSALYAADPPWSAGRDTQGNLMVDAGVPIAGSQGSMITFPKTGEMGDFFRSYYTGTSCGWDRSIPCDAVWYNGTIDGYNGKAPGGPTCINDCGEGNDLARLGAGLRHFLMKDVVLKNAFTSAPGQHIDLVQAVYSPNYDGWVVFQDCEWKNTDVQISNLAMGGTRTGVERTGVAGVMYQNVLIRQEAAFITDCQKRAWSDRCGSPNINLSAENGITIPNIWLIEVDAHKAFNIYDRSTGVIQNFIIVGENKAGLTFKGPSGGGVYSDNTKTYKYDFIEDALAAGHPEPPFIRLSDAGWKNPPTGIKRPDFITDRQKGGVKLLTNPVQGSAWFLIPGSVAPRNARLTILDAAGYTRYTRNTRVGSTLIWDGTDNTGNRVPPGIYFYSVKVSKKDYIGRFVKAW